MKEYRQIRADIKTALLLKKLSQMKNTSMIDYLDDLIVQVAKSEIQKLKNR